MLPQKLKMNPTEEKNCIVSETNGLVSALFRVVCKYRAWDETEIQLRAVLCDISHINEGFGH